MLIRSPRARSGGAALLLAVTLGAAPGKSQTGHAEIGAAVMGVLDRYMDALNALDLEAHVATYHFPHFRLAGGVLRVWQTPGEAMPALALPPEARRSSMREALHPDWARSVWVKRDIVQGDATKIHVATRFARLRADGSEISAYDSLYVVTHENGRWGIRGRSSFAP
jgi:hypothetical protein